MTNSISIVIATRNRAPILARALAALPAGVQGLEPPEVIVIDDCSTDATRLVAEEFAQKTGWRMQCITQSRPLGANAARNAGLNAGSGAIIVFIDDDVLVTEGWLRRLLSGLTDGNSVVAGPVQLTVPGPLLGKHREEVSGYFAEVLEAPKGLAGEIVPILGNMAVRREVFETATLRDTVRPPVEEIDWLHRAGVRAGFVPEALVWHYKTPEDIQLKGLLKVAWARGSEGGRWIRECSDVGRQQIWPMAARSLRTSIRAFGHALFERCWGGVVVGIGELSKAFSLAGITNRGARLPESWR